jgi:lipoprotein-releasing system ATP-binding protein
MTDVVLGCYGIEKTFEDGDVETRVLKGVDLELRAGEFVALVGPSGSGKSTLLSIMGTLLQPSAGELRVVGSAVKDMTDAGTTEFRNRHIGFVFQFHHLLPDFTATENVMFPSFARAGGPTEEAEERALYLLDRVGLSHRATYRASKLSGGQKQRVAVARAVMMKPAFVLADEPTGNLDRESSADVIALLREISREEKTAFLLSTHDPEIAANCDRIIEMVDGRVKSSGEEKREELEPAQSRPV